MDREKKGPGAPREPYNLRLGGIRVCPLGENQGLSLSVITGSVGADRSGGSLVQVTGRRRDLSAEDNPTRAGSSPPVASIGMEPSRTTSTQNLQGPGARCVDNLNHESREFAGKIRTSPPNVRKSG